jgi:hypothetical protein
MKPQTWLMNNRIPRRWMKRSIGYSLDEAQKEKIRNLPKLFDMIHYHHGLGTWIRNNFGLWYGNDELLQSCGYRRNKHNAYADYASFEILIALWKRFHNQD